MVDCQDKRRPARHGPFVPEASRVDSAYGDLVRLTGQNTAVEIAKRFEQKAA
jgi:hypothetical protein